MFGLSKQSLMSCSSSKFESLVLLNNSQDRLKLCNDLPHNCYFRSRTEIMTDYFIHLIFTLLHDSIVAVGCQLSLCCHISSSCALQPQHPHFHGATIVSEDSKSRTHEYKFHSGDSSEYDIGCSVSRMPQPLHSHSGPHNGASRLGSLQSSTQCLCG